MLNAKNRFFINVGLLIFMIGSFLYISQNYLLADIDNFSDQVVIKKQQLMGLKNESKGIEGLKDDYDKIEEGIDEVSLAVVGEGKIVDFIESIENTAEENKVKLEMDSIVSEEPEVFEGGIISKKFDVKAAGDFNRIISFLYVLENFDYYMNIEEIRIKQGDFDAYNRDLIVLDMEITVYQKEDE